VSPTTPTSIAPWLAVRDAQRAVEFYKAALGAVAQLSIGGAVFWVQQDDDPSPERQGAGSIRMILSVEDPDAVFAQAIAAGAAIVAPMSEDHGWRTGRITDPFGHGWEMSKQLNS
jgi:PhnB protein